MTIMNHITKFIVAESGSLKVQSNLSLGSE